MNVSGESEDEEMNYSAVDAEDFAETLEAMEAIEGADAHNDDSVRHQYSRGKIHFIDDRMLASMDKCKITTRNAMHFTCAAVEAVLRVLRELEVDPKTVESKDLVMNRTSIQSMRRDYRRRQAQQILDDFNVNN